jgi:hypothetical protein
VVPIEGARREPNAVDPRFGRFLSVDRDEGALPKVPALDKHLPALLGRVVFVSVFVGDRDREWSDAEIAKAHQFLTKAGAWIEREAARWGAPVNADLADTYLSVAGEEEDDPVELVFLPEGEAEAPHDAHAILKALAGLSRSAAGLGFSDAAELTARVNARIAADHRVWLVHRLRSGRSFAVPADESGLPGVTLAICYANEESFPGPLTGPPYVDPTTVVHEVLHLFGASDKYGVSLATFPPGSMTERDVMCLNFDALSRLRVDPLTAVEIGWVPALREAPADPESESRVGRPRPRRRPSPRD